MHQKLPLSPAASLELTILMPCLNEAQTVERCIAKALGFLRRSGVSGEVIVADNGSTDGSQTLAARAGARVVSVSTRGYGAAIAAGSQAARGRYIIVGDADDSYDFSALDGILMSLRAGHDLVMGNRMKGGIMPGAMPWKNRWLGNPVLSALGRLFFRVPIGDFHCGLRGYTPAAFVRMDLRSTGMEFASEMVIKAANRGLKICEVPIKLYRDGRLRPPHLRPWRDGWRHLRLMLTMSPTWLFLVPGLLALATGLLFGGALVATPLSVGAVGFDVGTLIFCAALTILGAQSVQFAYLAQVFSAREGLTANSASLLRIRKLINLERGLIVGLVLLALGLAFAVQSLASWQQHGYGALDPRAHIRIVIPAVAAMVLGAQLILTSFLASIIEVRFLPPAQLRAPLDESTWEGAA